MAPSKNSNNQPLTDLDLPAHSKICFVVCDPTKVEFINAYGDFTNLLTSMFTKLMFRFASLNASSLLPEVVKSFRIVPFKAFESSFPDLATIDQYDSIIVSGSSFSVNDGDNVKNEWINQLGALLHTVATKHTRIKIIGVCFGHQLISHTVFGDVVVQNPQWEIGPYQVDLNPIGKQIFIGMDHLNLEMFHHDAVLLPGTGHAPGVPAHASSFAPPSSISPGPAPPSPAQFGQAAPAPPTGEEPEQNNHSPLVSDEPLPQVEDAPMSRETGGEAINPEPAEEGSITGGLTGNEHLDSFAEETYATMVPDNERMIWGSTPMTPNQGIIALNKGAQKDNLNVDDIHIFTIQGHPEMTSGMISLLVDIFETDIGEDACKEGRERIANFKGSLDWFPVCLLMWALSTKHSVSLPQVFKAAQGFTDMVEAMKAAGSSGAALTSEQSVFVYVA